MLTSHDVGESVKEEILHTAWVGSRRIMLAKVGE